MFLFGCLEFVFMNEKPGALIFFFPVLLLNRKNRKLTFTFVMWLCICLGLVFIFL